MGRCYHQVRLSTYETVGNWGHRGAQTLQSPTVSTAYLIKTLVQTDLHRLLRQQFKYNPSESLGFCAYSCSSSSHCYFFLFEFIQRASAQELTQPINPDLTKQDLHVKTKPVLRIQLFYTLLLLPPLLLIIILCSSQFISQVLMSFSNINVIC